MALARQQPASLVVAADKAAAVVQAEVVAAAVVAAAVVAEAAVVRASSCWSCKTPPNRAYASKRGIL